MTQDKMRKMITAIVVAATLFFVILFSVLMYQWIKIGVYNKRIEKVKGDIAYYEQSIENAENDLQWYTSEQYKELEAYELGFILGQKK